MLQTFLFFLKAEERYFLNEKLINIVLTHIFLYDNKTKCNFSLNLDAIFKIFMFKINAYKFFSN